MIGVGLPIPESCDLCPFVEENFPTIYKMYNMTKSELLSLKPRYRCILTHADVTSCVKYRDKDFHCNLFEVKDGKIFNKYGAKTDRTRLNDEILKMLDDLSENYYIKDKTLKMKVEDINVSINMERQNK